MFRMNKGISFITLLFSLTLFSVLFLVLINGRQAKEKVR